MTILQKNLWQIVQVAFLLRQKSIQYGQCARHFKHTKLLMEISPSIYSRNWRMKGKIHKTFQACFSSNNVYFLVALFLKEEERFGNSITQALPQAFT